MTLHFSSAISAILMAVACANATNSSCADPAPQTAPASPQAIVPANGPVWHVDSSGGVFPASGSVDASAPCQAISLNLRQDQAAPPPAAPQLIGKPNVCPTRPLYMGYLRSTLFIEGLDNEGARLFVATGMNPLHQDVEAPPPPGGQMSWHSVDTSPSVVSTLINAPVTPALARLRWYDVDENLQPHLMGETMWTDVQPAAP